MYPTETRGAAARRQSDRPPSIDDDGDAEAPPRRAHGITHVPGGPLGQLLMLALAAVVAGVVVWWEGGRALTPWPPLSILREGEDKAASGTEIIHRLTPSEGDRAAFADERFTVYLVGSVEEAELLRGMIDGDVAEVRVITTDEQEAAFREAVLQANRVRVDKELPETTVIDLRAGQ